MLGRGGGVLGSVNSLSVFCVSLPKNLSYPLKVVLARKWQWIYIMFNILNIHYI